MNVCYKKYKEASSENGFFPRSCISCILTCVPTFTSHCVCFFVRVYRRIVTFDFCLLFSYLFFGLSTFNFLSLTRFRVFVQREPKDDEMNEMMRVKKDLKIT